jgi:NADH-quinone oxidoreductase subunit N
VADVFGSEVTTNAILDSEGPPALLLAGLALLIVGFGFKIAAVPFHSWTPDVYQGAPSPIVAFMASGVKAAGFAGLLRVLFEAFDGYADDWRPYVTGIAIATLIVGSVLAVVQTDVKRLLAYSSINHAGFILLGVIAATERGNSAALFYLAAYTFMVAGSFGIVTVVSRTGDDATGIDDFRGLARRRPLLALAFTVFLLSQAGVPFTAGFWAKAEVLSAAVDADRWYVALVAMVTAVIAAFIYLRVVVSMYSAPDEAEEGEEGEPEGRADVEGGRVPFGAKVALLVAAAATLLIGFLPGLLADLSDDAAPVADATSQE